MEPIEDSEEPDEPGGAREVAVHWCPNHDCPSNHALPGLVRVGVHLYVCESTARNSAVPSPPACQLPFEDAIAQVAHG